MVAVLMATGVTHGGYSNGSKISADSQKGEAG